MKDRTQWEQDKELARISKNRKLQKMVDKKLQAL